MAALKFSNAVSIVLKATAFVSSILLMFTLVTNAVNPMHNKY